MFVVNSVFTRSAFTVVRPPVDIARYYCVFRGIYLSAIAVFQLPLQRSPSFRCCTAHVSVSIGKLQCTTYSTLRSCHCNVLARVATQLSSLIATQSSLSWLQSSLVPHTGCNALPVADYSLTLPHQISGTYNGTCL